MECPNPEGSQKAKRSVEYFLTIADRLDDRKLVGATNETVNEISTVTDINVCHKLLEIVKHNEKYNTINQEAINSDNTIYFYKTENLYYVFWNKTPEYDNIPLTGPRTLFIVLSKDLTKKWEFYY
ncbi:MAG: hypothetical protein R3321_09810 [Nitrososphaeraceae archaeon]|nr:hypothetical protein [Nitrososphaeraceae archaeon]